MTSTLHFHNSKHDIEPKLAGCSTCLSDDLFGEPKKFRLSAINLKVQLRTNKVVLTCELDTKRCYHCRLNTTHAIVAQTATAGTTGFKNRLTVWEIKDGTGGETDPAVHCQLNNGLGWGSDHTETRHTHTHTWVCGRWCSWESVLMAHHHYYTAVLRTGDEGEGEGVGYQPVGDWGRRDVRLPELCKLASMLRLFLTASRECRLLRGVRLGMLCLSSSENHTHGLLNTPPAHSQHSKHRRNACRVSPLWKSAINIKGSNHAVFSLRTTSKA